MHFVSLPENQENASKILTFRQEFEFLQIVEDNCKDPSDGPCMRTLDDRASEINTEHRPSGRNQSLSARFN